MEVVNNIFSTLGAIHVNASITIGNFLMNNLTMFLVIGVVAYIAFTEFKSYEFEFIQDKRKVM